MHELSIAMSIVDIAKTELEKTESKSVSEIVLEIGKMSGVVMEALEFAMEEAKKNSILANAKILMVEKPAKAQCANCQHIFEIYEIYEACPKCNSFFSDVVEGKDMIVKSLKLE